MIKGIAQVFTPKVFKSSVQLERLAKAHPNEINEYVCDEDGHWLYLHNGWHFEEGAIHEHTVKDCLEKFKDIRHKAEACSNSEKLKISVDSRATKYVKDELEHHLGRCFEGVDGIERPYTLAMALSCVDENLEDGSAKDRRCIDLIMADLGELNIVSDSVAAESFTYGPSGRTPTVFVRIDNHKYEWNLTWPEFEEKYSL